MDTPIKNTRRRSRNISQGNKQQTSASANEYPNPNDESELAPNLNGDAAVKTGTADQRKSDSEEPKAADEEVGKGKTKGKKRKAEDENANEKNEKKDTDDPETTKEIETSKEDDKEEGPNVEEDTASDQGKNIKTADSLSPAKENKAESDKDECDTMDTPQRSKKRKQPESTEEAEPTPVSSKVETEAEESDMDLLPKQHLGKGKRARIPNKKYSNVIIASKRNYKITKGVEKKESERESSDMSTREESLSPLMIDQGDIEGPTKKVRPTTNIKDPKYLKPFEYGWKRELVIRGSGSNEANLKRNCDVYYFTPTGKKVRSMREVIENLTQKELTVDNFTFFKEAVGLNDPEKELIRAARRVSTPVMLNKSIEKPASKTPKAVKSPNKNEPSPQSSPKLPPIKTIDTPASEVKTRRRNAGKFKIDLQTIKKEMKKPEKKQQDDVETLPVSSKPTPAKKAKITNYNSEDKPRLPCSINCEGVHGLVPTLQCRLCLCLYHHECVGFAPHETLPYVCKNCQLENQENSANQSTILTAPPPLTPISALKSASAQLAPASITALPKLQRIPKPNDTPHILLEPEPSFPDPTELPISQPQQEVVTAEEPVCQSSENHKSLVGSVTTWLPHNAKIVDKIPQPSEEPTVEIPRPQYVEYLAGRKFLIIPKHNFLSISPNTAATAITKPASQPDIEMPNLPIDSTKRASEFPSNPEKSQTDVAGKPDEKDEVDEAYQDEEMKASATPKRSSKPTQKVPPTPKDKQEVKLQDNYCQNVCYTYNTMLYVFQFLKVQDLLRAGCVCKMWHDIANHRSLWQTVRMKNSQVHSFKGLANTLKKHGTRHLDLRKMLLPTGGDEIWQEFSEAVEKVDTLRKIELCRCPANVVEKLAVSNPNLEVINAVTIKCEAMDLSPLAALKQIKELKLKSTSGLALTSKLDALKDMKSLKHLSLTSIKELNKMNLDSITELTELESLELGECTDFPKRFGNEILIKLTKLEKLRLEKGQDECHVFDILEAVKNMPQLEQLELVNFDIKTGFDKALGSCQNIKQLLIIPRYITQSATTNHMVLEGVLKLRKSLSNFVWGVTLELLRVTELFLDQYDKKEAIEMKSSGNVDGIPILHPVSVDDGNTETSQNSLQMKILPLQSVQKLLMENLPTTRVKILKIPFHATWRQTIKDSVD